MNTTDNMLAMAEAAGETVSPKASASRVLMVRLGEERYGMRYDRVVVIKTLRDSAPVLHPPNYDKGFVIHEGHVVPMIDLRIQFGIDAKLTDETRLVVICSRRPLTGDKSCALLVDGVEEVYAFRPADAQSLPNCAPRGRLRFIERMVRLGGNIRPLLDLEQVAHLCGGTQPQGRGAAQ